MRMQEALARKLLQKSMCRITQVCGDTATERNRTRKSATCRGYEKVGAKGKKEEKKQPIRQGRSKLERLNEILEFVDTADL